MMFSFSLTIAKLIELDDTEVETGETVSLIALSILYVLAYLGMIVTTIIVTKSDPTDPTVAFDRQIRTSTVDIDEEVVDLIQNTAEFYCNICQAHVIENSKHCQMCNRCTYEFDHHCRWVSNDIGRLNYIPFVRMLLFVILTFIFQISICIVAITIVTRLKSREEEIENNTAFDAVTETIASTENRFDKIVDLQ